MATIHIGTSGWYYEHWKEIFYPKEIKTSKRLNYYAEHFDTVEVNNSFYRLPTEKVVKEWASKVPLDFIFSIKASQYITHRKRLKECEESVDILHARMKPLKNKLGPILFQLPPYFPSDLERLESFLKLLKKGKFYTLEFRHPSWFNESTYALLRTYQVALCITDLKGELSPEKITAPFVYIRLHGPKEEAYRGEYGPKKLRIWKKKIENWVNQKLKVFCYFDNDEKSYAIKDAKALKKMLKIYTPVGI